jgi:hypothetical protein
MPRGSAEHRWSARMLVQLLTALRATSRHYGAMMDFVTTGALPSPGPQRKSPAYRAGSSQTLGVSEPQAARPC